ncbi:MAG: DUF447 domain-containing protein [Planctomycetota bacterium]
MIIEGLLATTDEEGRVHLAAMGPVVDESLEQWTLRPFQTSQTFQNLRRQPVCVFHVIDDVHLLVRVVLGKRLQPSFDVATDLEWQRVGEGYVLNDACHWYQLRVTQWNVEDQRSEAKAIVVNQGGQRPFWGWNRAKHAIIEFTVLMTRLHLLDVSFIESELERLRSPVEKTAGPKELEAWSLLLRYWEEHQAQTVGQR